MSRFDNRSAATAARRALAALALLAATAVPASAQLVGGRVLDAQAGHGIAGVDIRLLNQAGTRVGNAVSDSAGNFRIAGRGPGRYTLQLSHIAYTGYRTPEFELPYMETVIMDVRMAPSVIPLEPITVTNRDRTEYHLPTYAGLYARMEQLPQVGVNRVVMKGDNEMRSTTLVREVLDRFFFASFRRGCVPNVYWNGVPIVNRESARIRLDQTNVDDLEAIEVYKDFLMAPAQFREPLYQLQTTPCAVVALWTLRPDLPGRKK